MDSVALKDGARALDREHGDDIVSPVAMERLPMATVLVSAVALSACGASDVTPGPPPPSPPVIVPPTITAAEASRFLGQATMGAKRTEIDALVKRGYDGWLSDQFAMPRDTKHWDWLVANGYDAAGYINGTNGFDDTMWRQLIAGSDQLRQRVGLALLEILVVGIGGLTINWKQFAMAAYVDVLLDNAFGNFRTILDAITTNAAMASFLTFLDNRKSNPTTGAVPDENYARELIQLFTLGLYKLNADGTVQGGGSPVETYAQQDVTGLAGVFTGLTLASTDSSTPDRYRKPLVMNAATNETGARSFLGTSTSGGGMAAIKVALDTIFAHQNVAPFIAKQLIQRLVSSNPSPSYVARVSAAFADNGAGVRGDMKAVIRAILLDREARGTDSLSSPDVGKLREPILRLTGWARACGASSPTNAWPIGDTSSQSSRLGESPGRSSTVFNFFRPGYAPPHTAIATAGMVAPEFQIANEQTVVAYINFMNTLVNGGIGDFKADYTTLAAFAADSTALIDEVNLILAAGQLSSATVASIKSAVDSIQATTANGPSNRVKVALLLTLASPDFLMVK
jgi:uncharacterized protein (DUF1800 family)